MEPDDYDHDNAQRLRSAPRQQMESVPVRSNLYESGAPLDAKFRTDSTPPIILLNFMYGVAAYKRWKTPPGEGMLKAYFAGHYTATAFPVPSPRAPSGESESSSDEQQDPKDSDYLPEDTTTSMEEAMEEVSMVLMYLSGITPEEAAIRREKRLEEEEQMAEAAGRRKVMEWIDTVRT
jgi:hypothetical protein